MGATAQMPQAIHYQSYLANPSSQPVNVAVNISFRIYTAAWDGAPVWSESRSGIGVINRIYDVLPVCDTPLILPFTVPYVLDTQVNSDFIDVSKAIDEIDRELQRYSVTLADRRTR